MQGSLMRRELRLGWGAALLCDTEVLFLSSFQMGREGRLFNEQWREVMINSEGGSGRGAAFLVMGEKGGRWGRIHGFEDKGL